MSIRRTALDALIPIIEEGVYANLTLKKAAAHVDAREVPFLYALVYATLEHAAYADYILAHYCVRQKRVVRNILRMAFAELLYMETPSHAALNEAVKLCKEVGKRDCAGLVNAVLRRLDAERDSLPPLPTDTAEQLSLLYGLPIDLIREWIAAYGAAFTRDLASAKPLGMQVRPQYPFTVEALKEALPVAYEAGAYDPNCLRLANGFPIESFAPYQEGKMAVQNEGAMLICRALGNIAGKRVLDACAAPGGKTAYLASLCHNQADFTAWELHPHRKELMEATFARLHVTAQTACVDAAVFRPESVGAFDAVLLDVPCSGFGLIHEKPDIRLHKQDDTFAQLLLTQATLLHVCSAYCKQGGTLVYATCTISKRENELQVQKFLSSHPSFHLEAERQFFPNLDHVDGFYYAKLRRE